MKLSVIFGQILIFFGFRPSVIPPARPVITPETDGPFICATDDPNDSIIGEDNGDYNGGYDPSDDYWRSRCGQPINTTRLFNTRIIGGINVKITEFPWQVSLQNYSQTMSESTHFCGGSLIHPNWVITAAHCLEWTLTGRHVRRDSIQRIRVIAGTQTLSPTANRLSLSVRNVVIYPLYETRTDIHDLALLELDRPIDLSMRPSWPVNTVCLPTDQDIVLASTLVTSGWGHTRENGYNSFNLKAVDLPLISQKQCRRVYGRGFATESMLCAGAEGKDSCQVCQPVLIKTMITIAITCQGDSGGPLIQFDRSTGKATLVGIVSVGNGCGRKDFPGIYTKVAHYVDWVLTSMGERKKKSVNKN